MQLITRRARADRPLKSHEEMFRAFARAASDLMEDADIPEAAGQRLERAVEALLDSTVDGLTHAEYIELALAHAGRLLDERERLEERLERELLDDDTRGCA